LHGELGVGRKMRRREEEKKGYEWTWSYISPNSELRTPNSSIIVKI
jgi:hypothetical protein